MSSLKKFILWFFVKSRLYIKNILKNELNNNNEVIIIWGLFINISDRLSEGKKPPDEIIVIDKLRELKLRILNKLRIIKITKVIDEYKRKILKDCFNVSALLNDIKFVKDFLKLLSKISINKIIENKK